MKPSIVVPSVFIATSLFLSGCTACQSEEAIQKDNFISASKELACEIVKNPKLALETPESKEKLKEIFSKYNLPIDNDETILPLFDKFSEDQSIKDAVREYLNTECVIETPITPAV